MDGAKKYYDYKERCIFCDIVRQEVNDGSRVVTQNDGFVAMAPFCSRFPFETWILPKVHNPSFENIGPESITGFSMILKDVLQRISLALNNPSYNYVLHSSPVEVHHQNEYHWHLEIMPKLTKVAGFEWGTGFYINPTTPEDAAHYLREIKTPQD
jgi:UDPglucose--hexose-1-phosphate uridylyltransferase